MEPGDWCYDPTLNEVCRVLALENLWEESIVLVWSQQSGRTKRISAKEIRSIEDITVQSNDKLNYICAASRISDEIGRGAVLSPLEGSLIPLPHQLKVLQRAISVDSVRFLLADEVGLGKTIEAGLILRELKNRGLVQRVLIVAPAGLVFQWISEMKVRFQEEFHLVGPSGFSLWRTLSGIGEEENLWSIHNQVICSIDSVKPIETKRGLSLEQVAKQNKERFEDLVTAGWDLVIIDEAHRLGGMNEQIARYRLGDGLSKSSPYLLLLSATPHQGKTDSFRRLIRFLDPDALPGDEAVVREQIAPLVIRTEKRHTIDAEGKPLFQPRVTKLETVRWDERNREQRSLYEAVTEYAREGYNRALKEKKTAHGLLMILLQRLVTSSTAAIRTALERRLETLQLPKEQLSLFPEDISDSWEHLEAQEQMEHILITRLKGLQSEHSEVELLLSAARRCEASAPDSKAVALLERIQSLQRDESDPAIKALVFTEYLPTQKMLADFLSQRGISVACLNGSMSIEERAVVQKEFADSAQVMISTDAGGEGLNLQFCHIVINYDLPWNPMKIEQRIGRIDRIGQSSPVKAFNFTLSDTVELRVREVLEEKLKRILEEFGVDKLADVLDSEESGHDFDNLFINSLISPDEAELRVEELVSQIRSKAIEAIGVNSLLASTARIDADDAKRFADSPVHEWTKRMVLSYLRSNRGIGTDAECSGDHFTLKWPDGSVTENAVFSLSGSSSTDGVLVTLADPRVRALLNRIPSFAPGQPIPSLVVPEISSVVSGIWSLWKVAIEALNVCKSRYSAVFRSNTGKVYQPTARAIWDYLLSSEESRILSESTVNGEEALELYNLSRGVAEDQCFGLYSEMLRLYDEQSIAECRKMTYSFSARKRAIERLGLPQVRRRRLAQLLSEESAWHRDVETKRHPIPALICIQIINIVSDS